VEAELRRAVRSLLRSRTVTLCAIACLALGIGATTAISSALSRALLQPLPFRDPERLVSVHRITPQSGPRGWSQSVPNYLDIAERSKQLESFAAVTWGTALINLPNDAIQTTQHLVTGNFFTTLGARAQLGRLLLSDDAREGAARVAVIGDELWRTQFGADPGVVGRTVTLNGQPTTIVGILPRAFRVPLGQNILKAQVWSPLTFTPDNRTQRRSNYLQTFGRLAPGATVESAGSELLGIFATIVAEFPHLKGDNVRVAPLHRESVQSVRKPLLLVFGAVCMVLLIAVTNVAALLLARGVQRDREMAVRSALGGARWDMLRVALVESVVLSFVSVVAGVALALGAVKSIGQLAAVRMPQLEGLRLDGGVLAFALVLSVLAAIISAAVPAWRAARVDPQRALQGSRGAGAGREHHRALNGLVVFEIALSLVLLVGAGLMLRSLTRLLGSDPGFVTESIVTLRVTASPARYPDQTGVRNFLTPAIATIQALPRVAAAGAISAVPYQVWGNNSGIRYEGMPGDEPTRLPIVEMRGVSPSFFDVTGQRLLAGRLLRAGDDEAPGTPRVVVVNEALVKRDFDGRIPLGRRYHVSDTTFGTIVGVVSDIKNMGPYSDPMPEMYQPYSQWGAGSTVFSLLLRVKSGAAEAVVPEVRSAIRSVDPTAAIADVATMDALVEKSLGRPRFIFTLLGSFAAVAVLLTVAGLYGVLSYAVAQRTREIGIRSALGSPKTALIGLFATQGLRLIALGTVMGLVGGLAATRVMESVLYGYSPLDTRTWVGAAALMVVAGMAAALVPAYRAARVDPIEAIRAE
jgi:putative ABC transport system permease protein